MTNKKLVLKREQISNLNSNHMSQLQGGEGSLFCFVTSKDNCTEWTWCENGNGCLVSEIETDFTCICNGGGGSVGVCPSLGETCNSCGENACTGVMTK